MEVWRACEYLRWKSAMLRRRIGDTRPDRTRVRGQCRESGRLFYGPLARIAVAAPSDRRSSWQRTNDRYGAGQRSSQPKPLQIFVSYRDHARISSRPALALLWAEYSALHAAADGVGGGGRRGNDFAGGCPGRSNGSLMGMTRRQPKILLAVVLFLSPFSALAERKPVAAQMQLPHNYYYREMYLPQLTSGPSALTFSPDGKELVYSMGGSLWRQTIGGDQARELTHAGGYDYQPDWSHDGR